MTLCGNDIARFHPNFSVVLEDIKKTMKKTLIKVFSVPSTSESPELFVRSMLGPPPTSFE